MKGYWHIIMNNFKRRFKFSFLLGSSKRKDNIASNSTLLKWFTTLHRYAFFYWALKMIYSVNLLIWWKKVDGRFWAVMLLISNILLKKNYSYLDTPSMNYCALLRTLEISNPYTRHLKMKFVAGYTVISLFNKFGIKWTLL